MGGWIIKWHHGGVATTETLILREFVGIANHSFIQRHVKCFLHLWSKVLQQIDPLCRPALGTRLGWACTFKEVSRLEITGDLQATWFKKQNIVAPDHLWCLCEVSFLVTVCSGGSPPRPLKMSKSSPVTSHGLNSSPTLKTQCPGKSALFRGAAYRDRQSGHANVYGGIPRFWYGKSATPIWEEPGCRLLFPWGFFCCCFF